MSSDLRSEVHNATTAKSVQALYTDLKILPADEIETWRKIEFAISSGKIKQTDIAQKLGARNRLLLDKLFLRSAVERETILLMAEGVDPEQIRLYADFLYCSSPNLDSQLIKTCVAEARTRSGINTVKTVETDRAEEVTYFSKQSLINMLTTIEFGARAKEAIKDVKSAIDLAADYLDARPSLEAHFSICGEPTEDVLANITSKSLQELGLDSPAWQRMQTLRQYNAIQGFFKNGDETVLFIGKTKPNAIEFDGVAWNVLSPEEANLKFKTYCSGKIAAASTDKMRLYCTYPISEGRVVEFPNSKAIILSTKEEASLRAGIALPEDHPLTKSLDGIENNVLFSSPYMEKESTALVDADSFAFALQRAYPKAKLLRDPLSEKTSAQTGKVVNFSVTNPSDILVVVPDPKLNVPQAKTIGNIAADLKSAGVNVTVFAGTEKYSGPSGKAVFVITGHSSEELAEFVRQLGEGGFLKDNYVVFNSCETEMTRQLIAEINGRFGAVGTYAFEGKILAASVQDYLLSLVKGLTGKPGQNLIEILNRAVRDQKLNGVFTICMSED